MLDGFARRLVDPALMRLAGHAVARGVSADALTGIGLLASLACAGAIAAGVFPLALLLLALSRLCDGLDGAVARLTRRTDRGGFLDIVADFVFYGAVPLAFAVRDPAHAVPAAVLLFAFYVNGATFLAYAAVAGRRGLETTVRGEKSLYFTAGLAEGAETILAFVLMILNPWAFPAIALVFAALCLLTAATRVLLAWRSFV